MSKNNTIFSLILCWFWGGLGEVFEWFFGVKIWWKPRKRFRKKAYETLAMATKSRVRVLEIVGKFWKNLVNLNVFWNFAFGQIFKGFCNGFGTPKLVFFAFVSHICSSQFRSLFWKAEFNQSLVLKGGGTVSNPPSAGWADPCYARL